MKVATKLLTALLVLVGASADISLGQRAEINGTVVDATDGGGLPANIILGGTATGSQASALDGTYSITGIEPGTYSIEFSLIGYITYRVPVTLAAGQTLVLDARLNESVLDVGGEITVIGGVTQKREDFPMPMETGRYAGDPDEPLDELVDDSPEEDGCRYPVHGRGSM